MRNAFISDNLLFVTLAIVIQTIFLSDNFPHILWTAPHAVFSISEPALTRMRLDSVKFRNATKKKKLLNNTCFIHFLPTIPSFNF